ncbi:AzlC family ABC transporter permease [Polaromonas sp.]|uniref:AzlC family ABC transporter permease n=1 Tax=Polaromonas sp. TaxID=1869339 RepID=UPI0024875EA2|nr:AzlC family ABC transporter permease [Polaromonas sp.]MDI1274605.1 AzlC family ABC transporter permease [Polaromonas sp.]
MTGPDLNSHPPSTRFSSRKAAFRQGFKDALRAPVLVLIAGMLGFGAAGHMYGLGLLFTTATTVFLFALPGQIVLFEMLMSGASLLSVGIAVSLTSSRFVTMAVTLFPQLHHDDRRRGLYASVHLLAMTAWTVAMREFPSMAPEHRSSYFVGFGLPCWLLSVPATALGYVIAGQVPMAVTLSLVWINPLFFLLTFTEVKLPCNRLAILLGGCLGPAFFLLDSATSLLAAGLVGGSLAYGWQRLRSRQGGVKGRP